MLGGPIADALAIPPNPLADLSKREEGILKLVAPDKSNRQPGEALDLQEKTVMHDMTSVPQKLQVRNRVEAAMLARQYLKGCSRKTRWAKVLEVSGPKGQNGPQVAGRRSVPQQGATL